MIDLGNYQTFLYLLGSFFVPLFGVLLADWLRRAARTTAERDVFEGAARALAADRRVGSPASASTSGSRRRGRAGGRTLVAHTDPARAAVGGASLPSFALAFALAAARSAGRGVAALAARVIAARREPLARPR